MAELVAFYRENGPGVYGRAALVREDDPFGLEGYLCLLIGQKVPCARQWAVSGKERRWAEGYWK